jgi:hypothetical protein
MGIEARCPNGHEVRVKDRFAGRRVYCPECAAKFHVPMPGAATTPPTAAVVSLDAAYAATLPRATPAGACRTAAPGREDQQQPADKPGRAKRERPRHRRSAPRDTAAAAPAPAATPPHAPPPGRLHPVIAEAVDLTWNVALPGGDPSEPLTAGMLQEWLDGGGATGKELVWRADWPDWVPIRLVFPEHVPKAMG